MVAMPEFPADHPLAPYADDLESHADHLEAYGSLLSDADPGEIEAAMVVVTGESGTDTFPTVSEDVDPRWASLWMLGAHIHHVADAARASGDGTMTMEEAAQHAIGYIREHTGAQEVY